MKYVLLTLCLLAFIGCTRSSEPALKVAATSIPHGEILEAAKPLLKEQGIHLEIIIVEDYNTPNRALNDGEVDANFFQHLPFLQQQAKDFGYGITSLAPIHLEPMGLYSKKVKGIEELRPGSTIAVPADPSNQARALNMLAEQELIGLSKTGEEADILHITNNHLHYHFIEIDSALLVRSLDDVDAAAINTNFALQGGLSPKQDAILQENAASRFVNILAVRIGEENRHDIMALKNVLRSDEMKSFIKTHYQGSIISAD
ncbi:MAG: MetQ/NlpA family ABC transporter substrate-binding protein [Parachlamydia sp.]|jgi:D-methionine transport system substrate-binding protein|nr:MetQ/NlpA family ABC transporter substrate-binding protein [Parachlamydia sp.]